MNKNMVLETVTVFTYEPLFVVRILLRKLKLSYYLHNVCYKKNFLHLQIGTQLTAYLLYFLEHCKNILIAHT